MQNSNGLLLARVLFAFIIVGSGLCVDATAQLKAPAPDSPQRVLFVGNSLTYYGNVPAVFSALTELSGKSLASDMIVVPGGTLHERVSDGSVAEALDANAYSAIVLQERGGDLICAFGPESCPRSREALEALAALAREHGVRAVLMGSYQPLPALSKGLVEAESAAAAEVGIVHIEVSEKLQQLRESAPELTWFAEDGMHPGKHLALLNALLVHEALLGELPTPGPLVVNAPIYAGNTGLDGSLRKANDPPPRADTPTEVRYSSETLAAIIRALDDYR